MPRSSISPFALGLAAVTAVAGCHRPAPPAPAAPAAVAAAPGRLVTSPGKAGAPVHIETALDLAAGVAHVQLVFSQAANDVAVEVRGLDGLEVTRSGGPAPGASYAAGAVAAFDVAFTPAPGRAFLVVGVSGDFGIGRRDTSVAVPVGEPSAAQRKAEDDVIVTPSGERLKKL